MLLDLNDPASIIEWWKVYPARHGALLRDWADRRPDVRPAIISAGRMMRSDPQLRRFLEAQEAHVVAGPVLSHDEQAAEERLPDGEVSH